MTRRRGRSRLHATGHLRSGSEGFFDRMPEISGAVRGDRKDGHIEQRTAAADGFDRTHVADAEAGVVELHLPANLSGNPLFFADVQDDRAKA